MKIEISVILSVLLCFQFATSSQLTTQIQEKGDAQTYTNELLNLLPDDSELANDVNQLIKDLEELAAKHANERKELDDKYEADKKDLNEEYDTKIEDLNNQIDGLEDEIKSLDQEINSLKKDKKECKNDKKKKKDINNQIKDKRNEKKQNWKEKKVVEKELKTVEKALKSGQQDLDQQYKTDKNNIKNDQKEELNSWKNDFWQLAGQIDDYFDEAEKQEEKEKLEELAEEEKEDEEQKMLDDQIEQEEKNQKEMQEQEEQEKENEDQSDDQQSNEDNDIEKDQDSIPEDNEDNEKDTCNTTPIYYKQPVTAIIGDIFNKQGYDNWNYDDFQYVEAITIYFTASWCGACKSFTPTLEDFYKDVNSGSCFRYENVACLYDDQNAYNSYSQQMSCAIMPQGLYAPYTTFDVSGIPALILIHKDGSEANRNGRSDVTNKGTTVFEDWVETVANYDG